MRLVYHPADGSPRPLATTVETADTVLTRARGLMFRRTVPDDYALVFRFRRSVTRTIHTVFVFAPIDVVWLIDGKVQRIERLAPWTGFARARADTIVELPAGAADPIEPGDTIRLGE